MTGAKLQLSHTPSWYVKGPLTAVLRREDVTASFSSFINLFRLLSERAEHNEMTGLAVQSLTVSVIFIQNRPRLKIVRALEGVVYADRWQYCRVNGPGDGT
jgi:hypothetical protein